MEHKEIKDIIILNLNEYLEYDEFFNEDLFEKLTNLYFDLMKKLNLKINDYSISQFIDYSIPLIYNNDIKHKDIINYLKNNITEEKYNDFLLKYYEE